MIWVGQWVYCRLTEGGLAHMLVIGRLGGNGV